MAKKLKEFKWNKIPKKDRAGKIKHLGNEEFSRISFVSQKIDAHVVISPQSTKKQKMFQNA